MNLKTFHQISYGMYIISSKWQEKFNGQIANTVFQITAEPPTVAVSINKQNLTREFIKESKVFTISILSEEASMTLIGQFGFRGGREMDKFKDISYDIGKTGVPILLENTIGYLEVELINSIDVGTHTVFIGKIVESEIIKEGRPMTYQYYHEVKKGKTQKTAPTYIKEDGNKEEKKEGRYKCLICGYIYDPEKGDPDSGIKPGTPFEDLPPTWVCPVCGAAKDQFESGLPPPNIRVTARVTPTRKEVSNELPRSKAQATGYQSVLLAMHPRCKQRGILAKENKVKKEQ